MYSILLGTFEASGLDSRPSRFRVSCEEVLVLAPVGARLLVLAPVGARLDVSDQDRIMGGESGCILAQHLRLGLRRVLAQPDS